MTSRLLSDFLQELQQLLTKGLNDINMATSSLLNHDNTDGFLGKAAKCQNLSENQSEIIRQYDMHVKPLSFNDKLHFIGHVFDTIDTFLPEAKANISRKLFAFNLEIAKPEHSMNDRGEYDFYREIPIVPLYLSAKYRLFIGDVENKLKMYDRGQDIFTNGQEFVDFLFPIIRNSCFTAAYIATCHVAVIRHGVGDVGRCRSLMSEVEGCLALEELQKFGDERGNDVTMDDA
ncbi:hypothetical protein H4219_005406 [Mycoemilia scoparia]|uniref:Uncharacterized protein n=1 Tax=Mycoemilia scoparia TaxID=417184 RepID=A0A9W8DPD5_9FUNG|nr:hypothetical protein H4219_005406 [Mycoemilia scoparia]